MTGSQHSIEERIRDTLTGVPPEEYGSLYQDHLLEIYKTYLELADRISGRREKSNSFFLAANTALVAIVAKITVGDQPDWPKSLGIFLAIVAILLCFVWRRAIRSYRGLNSAKFKVVHAIERQLPLRPYDAEWEGVGRGKNSKLYLPFTRVESVVPGLLMAVYAALAVYNLPWEAIRALIARPT